MASGREIFASEPLFVSEIGPVIGAHAELGDECGREVVRGVGDDGDLWHPGHPR